MWEGRRPTSAAPLRSNPVTRPTRVRPSTARHRAVLALDNRTKKSRKPKAALKEASSVQYAAPRFEQKVKGHDVAGAIMSSNALGRDMAHLCSQLQDAGFDNMRPMHHTELIKPHPKPKIASGTVGPKQGHRSARSRNKMPGRCDEQVLSPKGPSQGLYDMLQRIAIENEPALQGMQHPPSSPHPTHPHVRAASPPPSPPLAAVNKASSSPTSPAAGDSCAPWGEDEDALLTMLAERGTSSTARPSSAKPCAKQPSKIDTKCSADVVTKVERKPEPIQELCQMCAQQIEAATRNASDMETVSMDLKAVLTRFRNQGAGIPSGVAKEAAERMVLSSVKEAFLRSLRNYSLSETASLVETLNSRSFSSLS